MEIAAQCDNLRQLVAEYEEKHRHGNESVGPHPRECIPNEHKEPIINWLLGKRSVSFPPSVSLSLSTPPSPPHPSPPPQESPQQADQLRRDKEELLKQVVSLQKEVEHSSEDSSKLSSKARCSLLLHLCLLSRRIVTHKKTMVNPNGFGVIHRPWSDNCKY